MSPSVAWLSCPYPVTIVAPTVVGGASELGAQVRTKHPPRRLMRYLGDPVVAPLLLRDKRRNE